MARRYASEDRWPDRRRNRSLLLLKNALRKLVIIRYFCYILHIGKHGGDAMYSQGLIGAKTETGEDEVFLAAFQARIDADEKIEPNDPMPEGYRRTLIRQI